MNSEFVYSPFTEDDCIRILLLQPAISRDDDLRGSLQQIFLARYNDDLIESYTALSYVWGDPTPVDKILLNGHELGITANLGAALRDMRDASRTHRLWADAVCIDQSNILERSKQVGRMGEIYTRQYAHSSESEILAIKPQILRGNGGSTSDTISLVDAAHKGLLCNPWFRRTWVLQELVRSRAPWVQCGLKRVRWQDLCHLLISWLRICQRENSRHKSKRRQADEDIQQIAALESMNKIRTEYYNLHNGGGPNKRTLLEVLQARKGCQVSDPRDFIFAHMGIISDRAIAEEFIRVDYSLTTSEVFAAVARYVLLNYGVRSMLAIHTPSPSRTMLSLPSCVPDWGVEIDPPGRCWKTQAVAPAFSHCNDHVLPLPTRGGATIVALSGILPAPSLLEQIKRAHLVTTQFLGQKGLWNQIVDMLPVATKDSTLNQIGLRSWSSEAVRLGCVQYTEEKVACVRNQLARYVYDYSKCRDEDARPYGRLALLNNGMVLIVPHEALCGDIIVSLRTVRRAGFYNNSKLTVRPYASRSLTDLKCALTYEQELEGVNLEDCWFQYASFIGVCAFKGVIPDLGPAFSFSELDRWHMPGPQDAQSPLPILMLH
ncbi:heterokaryon incompatibility protein-domain-containing protein [Xylaria cf. heliscus]|nr:heterokaryon incompatibility protein-domain-containing protein [Xylaria cf. heliscus]